MCIMKTVFITGASRGIGRACALRFAREGFAVGVNFVSSACKAQELKEEILSLGGECEIYPFDVSDSDEAEKAINAFSEKYGGIDCLVCNAGIAAQDFFDKITGEDWDRMFAVNTKGAFNCSKFAAKHMLHAHKGKIVFVSSVWGIQGASMEVHYSASKAALIGLTKALCKELGPSGINVNCVAPGVIDTDMNRMHSRETMLELSENTPLMRIGQPSDVANAVFFLSSQEADFITGQIIAVDGGFSL